MHQALAAYADVVPGAIDWAGVHAGKGHRTMTLPTYPFNRQNLVAPPARRERAASAVGHPLFDRHYEHRSEGQ
ncbi:acyltransferase, partial [Streptomyces sp. AHA2]